MNIVVSGWPGAGSSTLGLIIADLLDYNLLRGSQTFRLIGQKLGYALTGEDRIKADTYLEEYWGPLYDKYVDYVLLNKNKFLIESDIAAFRIGLNDNIFSIFLAPSLESRQERLKMDGRPEEVDLLTQREQDLNKDYLKLHNIDWLSLEKVRATHNITLDTSSMNIETELKLIFEAMEVKVESDLKKVEEEFWKNGKEFYMDKLKDKDLLIPTEEIIRDIVKTFPKDIESLPTELRDEICKI